MVSKRGVYYKCGEPPGEDAEAARVPSPRAIAKTQPRSSTDW